MGFLNKLKELAEKQKVIEQYDFELVGCNYYRDDIAKVMMLNPVYKRDVNQLIDSGYVEMPVYKYLPLYTQAKLVAEPKNEHDPNAIFLQINGKKIGYIMADQTKIIKPLMSEHLKVTAKITGGGCKKVVKQQDGTYGILNRSIAFYCNFVVEVNP